MKTQIRNLSLLIVGLISINATNLLANTTYNHTYVKVQSSKPIYKLVDTSVPYEEIVTTSYIVKVPCGRNYPRGNHNHIGLDTIIGAGIGIAVANKIVKNKSHIKKHKRPRHKDATRVIGGLVGATIANSHRNHHPHTKYCEETRYKDEVITKYKYATQRILTGYKNKFVYQGITYKKISKHPLKRVKITTSISF